MPTRHQFCPPLLCATDACLSQTTVKIAQNPSVRQRVSERQRAVPEAVPWVAQIAVGTLMKTACAQACPDRYKYAQNYILLVTLCSRPTVPSMETMCGFCSACVVTHCLKRFSTSAAPGRPAFKPNIERSNLHLPSTRSSVTASPMPLQNLNPWPLHADTIATCKQRSRGCAHPAMQTSSQAHSQRAAESPACEETL